MAFSGKVSDLNPDMDKKLGVEGKVVEDTEDTGGMYGEGYQESEQSDSAETVDSVVVEMDPFVGNDLVAKIDEIILKPDHVVVRLQPSDLSKLAVMSGKHVQIRELTD